MTVWWKTHVRPLSKPTERATACVNPNASEPRTARFGRRWGGDVGSSLAISVAPGEWRWGGPTRKASKPKRSCGHCHQELVLKRRDGFEMPRAVENSQNRNELYGTTYISRNRPSFIFNGNNKKKIDFTRIPIFIGHKSFSNAAGSLSVEVAWLIQIDIPSWRSPVAREKWLPRPCSDRPENHVYSAKSSHRQGHTALCEAMNVLIDSIVVILSKCISISVSICISLYMKSSRSRL